MMSTVVGAVLIAAGAILRFAVPATVTDGLNTHVVSIIVMLAGIFSLLLSLLVWRPPSRRSRGRESMPPENEHRAAHRVS